MENEKRHGFYVGVNVFALRDKKLLLDKRINVYGAGTWGLPGGHLEKGELMVKAAARELMEETGLKAERYDFANIVNDSLLGQSHYIQIGFLANNIKGDPILKEPDKCGMWRWFSPDELPKEIFPGHIKQIEIFFKNITFYDS